ncbi:RluA family pseudouridine synthase [Candidatus Parcubacteria bacterium]|nr:RluA family pseudouridine synthase [Candidatus Parcubacteria bacterium]
MQNFKIIYEDEDLSVIDKPAGLVVDNIERRVHRLDKDTSGILLVAKNDKALEFLQKQFKERKVKKKYLALVIGHLKTEEGVGDEAKASSSPFAAARVIETLIGRSPGDRRKQKVYLPGEPNSQGKRQAVTEYKVLQRFENYDLIEVEPRTGRKHQIRTHLAYLGHPIAGDKLYGFKGQICPEGLKRHFLHASYLKIKLPDGETKEFKSELPDDLKLCLINLKPL